MAERIDGFTKNIRVGVFGQFFYRSTRCGIANLPEHFYHSCTHLGIGTAKVIVELRNLPLVFAEFVDINLSLAAFSASQSVGQIIDVVIVIRRNQSESHGNPNAGLLFGLDGFDKIRSIIVGAGETFYRLFTQEIVGAGKNRFEQRFAFGIAEQCKRLQGLFFHIAMRIV